MMSKWSDAQENTSERGPSYTGFTIPGSFVSPSKQNQRAPLHRHNVSNGSASGPSNSYHAYRDLTSANTNVSSPKSIHTRSDSNSIQNNVSPLIRSKSKKRSQPTNYLKLIPPMPDPQFQQQQQQQQIGSSSQATNKIHLQQPHHYHNQHPPPQFSLQQRNTGSSTAASYSTKDSSSLANSPYYNTPPTTVSTRGSSLCATCHKPITTKSVKALEKRYHTQCFGCADCGTPILSNFSLNVVRVVNLQSLKQYVEIFRGGRNQKWHVECYMIHKCWNVSISPGSIGIAAPPIIEPTEENLKLPDINPTPEELIDMETKAGEKISEIWNTLFKFEEDTATCISDMLQFATIHDQRKGLVATVRLILKIDALFKSIDSLHRLGINSQVNHKNVNTAAAVDDDVVAFQTLKKEPRNLSAKIMIYLAILRKASKGVSDPSNSQDLILSVVTGLAHYLKLLIRYGLYNSLQYNKSFHTTNALDKFLREIRVHENIPNDPLDSLDIPLDASDLCAHCQKSIESACVQYQDKRWHVECLHCTKCNKNLQAYDGVADACYNSKTNWVLCAQCAMDDPDAKGGFRSVSKLLQLGYLLKIAIVRSKAVMDYEFSHRKINIVNDPQSAENQNNEQSYMKTLNDIKRLRSTRQNTRITNFERENARKSVVIETTEFNSNDDLQKPNQLNSQFMSSEENVTKQKITVEDEPMGPSLSKKSFNRATTFINNQKVLTLDDIPRIVAAEHARELRPNTYKFHNPHQESNFSKDIKAKSNSLHRGASSIQQSSNIEGNKSPDLDIKYYSQLSDQEYFIITHIADVVLGFALSKDGVGRDVDATKFIDLKKTPTFWEKLRQIGNSEKKIGALSKVFGAELKDLTAKAGIDSSQSNGPSKVRVPMLIDDLLAALYQKDMSVEGVFRKNGNIKRLKEITNEIDINPSKVPDLLNENAVQLSALLKKFLRELPTPLLTFKLYDLWILTQKVKDDVLKRVLIEISYSLLPKAHRDLAEVLLFFFMWTSSFSHLDEESGSKMDIHNLATVLSPNILYAKPAEIPRPSSNGKGVATTYYDAFSEGEGENYYLAIEVVNYLIEHNEQLSIVPSYLLEIYKLCKFEKVDHLTSKDIFLRVESVLKSKPELLERIFNGTNPASNSGKEQVIQESNNQQPLETAIENL
ncbi:unnamed protein product [Wickerhamomyces anomalus]